MFIICSKKNPYFSKWPLDETTANEINQRQFVEVIIATDYSEEALEILKSKKNIRVLKVDLEQDNPYPGVIKKVSGGILIQSDDSFSVPESSLVCASKRQPSEKEMGHLLWPKIGVGFVCV